MKTIDQLLTEYKAEHLRTTGKDIEVRYKGGWFRLHGVNYRRKDIEGMLATLKTRVTVYHRQEMVNGVLTMIEAHQHVVKSYIAPHKDVIEDRDIPWCCSVQSETYWSN